MFVTRPSLNIKKERIVTFVEVQRIWTFITITGLTELLETWMKKQNITIKTEEEILGLREDFIEENMKKYITKLLLYAISSL